MKTDRKNKKLVGQIGRTEGVRRKTGVTPISAHIRNPIKLLNMPHHSAPFGVSPATNSDTQIWASLFRAYAKARSRIGPDRIQIRFGRIVPLDHQAPHRKFGRARRPISG